MLEPKVDFEKPLTVALAQRPIDYDGEYMFVTASDGTAWKARIALQESGAAIGVTVTVSQVDEDGKAIRRDDVPLVGEPLTRSLQEVEYMAEGFDFEAHMEERILRIVEARIEAARMQFSFKDRLTALASKLTQAKPPDQATQTKPLTSETEE